jgi:hypothetical protein
MASDLPVTEAVLNYLAPTSEKPRSYTYAPPDGVPPRARTEKRAVQVIDARKLAEAPTLDREGFALVPQPTAVTDFLDEAQLKRIFYPEVESVLKSVTGGEKVVIFDHTLRSAASERDKGVREPVRYVHNDYTVKSGKQRVRDLLSPDEAEVRLRGRHSVINLWRSIRGPVLVSPLALADARSIRVDDWVATDLVYPDRLGEVYSVRHNPAHRWYFYSKLQPDEAVLIKTYDSLEDGTARFSAHSAFEDPASPVGAPPRESIEVRALVFYPQPRG